MNSLLQTIANTENSGRMHMFLGHPLSDGGDKTVIEPGNTSSPGVWTCGISLWWERQHNVITPDMLPPEKMEWVFGDENGLPPEVTAKYDAFGRTITHKLANLGAEGSEGVDFHHVTTSTGTAMKAYIVVKSEGPAGKKLSVMAWDDESGILTIGGGILLVPETAPETVHLEWIGDEPVAALEYPLFEGDPFSLRFKVIHRFEDCPMGAELPISRHAGLSVGEGFAKAGKEWNDALPARIFSPNYKLTQVWERCCAHILNAMELGNPRIGAVHYPLFWMRDGVLVLRALDLMGRHDLARIGCEMLAPTIYAGGFGAEADAPGEGIWALVAHARMTRDTAFLQEVFPLIQKRVAIIEEMITTTKIMRGLSECRAPMCVDWPTNNIICFPAEDGCINGRMDHHHPNFYINLWALQGLRDAAEAARLLMHEAIAGAWQKKADILALAIERNLLPAFGTNERDSIVTPHPCNVIGSRTAFLHRFKADFLKRRLIDGKRHRETLWTYFEAAQLHNAMLMGMVEETWVCLRGLLSDGPYDASVYVEGDAGDPNHDLKFGNGENRRGWLNHARSIAGNMPHNWTNAEMVSLIRDIYVCEEEGMLVLGRGMPKEWLAEGAQFGVSNMPTTMGPVSYIAGYNDGTLRLIKYEGPENHILYKERVE